MGSHFASAFESGCCGWSGQGHSLMSHLPTVQNFGPRPTPRAPRGVIPIRAAIAQSAAAKGRRELAKGFGEADLSDDDSDHLDHFWHPNERAAALRTLAA